MRRVAATPALLGMCRDRKDRERRCERKDDFSIHSGKPLFRPARAVKTANPHGPSLLTGFVAPCLLQISKIATILRQTVGGWWSDSTHSERQIRSTSKS